MDPTRFNDPSTAPTLHDNAAQLIADLAQAKTHVADLEGQLRATFDALKGVLGRQRKAKAAKPATGKSRGRKLDRVHPRDAAILGADPSL